METKNLRRQLKLPPPKNTTTEVLELNDFTNESLSSGAEVRYPRFETWSQWRRSDAGTCPFICKTSLWISFAAHWSLRVNSSAAASDEVSSSRRSRRSLSATWRKNRDEQVEGSLTVAPGRPLSPGKPRRPGGPSLPEEPCGPGSPYINTINQFIFVIIYNVAITQIIQYINKNRTLHVFAQPSCRNQKCHGIPVFIFPYGFCSLTTSADFELIFSIYVSKRSVHPENRWCDF